jgi:hypothetical protein
VTITSWNGFKVWLMTQASATRNNKQDIKNLKEVVLKKQKQNN